MFDKTARMLSDDLPRNQARRHAGRLPARAERTGKVVSAPFRPYNRTRLKPAQRQGEMENQIKNAIIKFEQEFMGRGPDEVRAFIVRDLIVIRLKGVLTPAERQLAKTAEGVEMVKRLRQNLIAQGRDKLMEQIQAITGAKTTALFTDIDTQIGERVFVFTLDRDLGGSHS
jgi:uncharacterized protein YbcI